MRLLPFTILALSLIVLSIASESALAGNWMFRPSTYSHSPVTGDRVTQYAPIPPVIIQQDPSYTRSGYRQSRSTIRAGGSTDNYHIVEQYGQNIRPYGEWLYPYRPYSTPYDAWGPPFGGVNGEYSGEAYLRGGVDRRRDYRGDYRDDYRRDDRYRDDFRRDERGRGDYRYDDRAFDARSRDQGRYNGLFDGRGIPGEDEHYLDQPSRLDQMNDREFYRPRSR